MKKEVLIAIILIVLLLAILSLPWLRRNAIVATTYSDRGKLHIADVRVSDVGEASATVTWHTNLPADTQVVWGKNTPGEFATPRLSELTTRHAAVLEPLEEGTHYTFTVMSTDASGNTLSMDGPRFRTRGLSRFVDLCDGLIAGSMKELPSMGTGIAWGDFDNDGDFDVFIASERTHGSRLFRYDSRTFANCTSLLPSKFAGRARSAAWADFDLDGNTDLLVVSSAGIWLFKNEGPPAWKFEDLSDQIPLQKRYDCEGAGWIDYNNDGRPDILVTNGKSGILVFENRSRGTVSFFDVSAAVGLGETGFGHGFGDFIGLFDYNGDGRTDFLYNLYNGVLGRNAGGKFVQDTQSGIDYYSSSTRKLGTAFGDFDNDGDLDLFVPQRGQCMLYRNDGGRFTDVTAASGIAASDNAVVAAWGDINNDGWLDLYVGNEFSLNRLYVSQGNGTFQDKAQRYGVGSSSDRPRGTCFVDFDQDGDLDLYVHGYSSPDYFYENTLIEQDNHNYLSVKFSPGNCAVGARVFLYHEEKLSGMREISGGEGYGSQSPAEAQFGAQPGEYKVLVKFTNGTTRDMSVTVDGRGRNSIIVP